MDDTEMYDANSEFNSLFSIRGDSSAMDDTGTDGAHSQFNSLFSVRGHASEDDESEDPLPGAIQANQALEDDVESVPNARTSVESGEGSVVSLSLLEFVVLAKQLAENHDAVDVFCKFVLTGVLNGQQYQIDPIKHALGRADEIKASRDYDSVLGFGKHIFLDCDITLHLVPKLEDTLRRNIHIKRDFTNIHVRTICHTKRGSVNSSSTGYFRRRASPLYP